MKRLAALLLATSLPAMAGDWTEPTYTDDVGYVSTTSSVRFENSFLAIFAWSAIGCDAIPAMVTLHEDASKEARGTADIRLRVDGGKIYNAEVISAVNNVIAGKYRTREIYKIPNDNDAMATALLGGHKVIIQVGNGETDEFSLNGITAAAKGVMTACKRLGKDEWRETPAKGEWEA
jgi:hypothetical protein